MERSVTAQPGPRVAARRRLRALCTAVAAVTATLGVVPVVAQSFISSAAAATANCSASLSGNALSRSGWVASTNTAAAGADVAANAIDGNLSTRFSSDAFQAPGMSFELNLGSPQSFDEIDMQVPNSPGDWAKGFNVEVSNNGSTWTTVANCTGSADPEVVSFGTVTDQYLQVVLTAGSTTNWWSIDEVNLYAPAASGINTSDWYQVANQGSGSCVDDTNGSTANGNPVQQWVCGAGNFNQEWQFQATSGGYYDVLDRNAAAQDEVWDVTGGSGATAPGTKVQTWAYGGGTNQQWLPVTLPNGDYTLEARNSGLCLEVPGASTTNGVVLDVNTCNGTGAQAWALNLASGSTTTTTAPTTTTTAPTTTTTKPVSANCSASLTGNALSRSGWAASTNTAAAGADVAANAIDGNLSTRFSSDAFQAPGMSFELNLGSPQSFDEIDMQVPNSPGDWAKGFNVEVSNNGSTWTTVASCTGAADPEVASFGTVTDQYLQVVLTASSTTNWWSIDEVNLYGVVGGGGTTTTTSSTTTSSTTTTTVGSGPPTGGSLGPNVFIFTPQMSQSSVQATITNLYNQQAGNEFGTQRYALLFEPGTYGSAANPMLINTGYYEEFAGLGQNPGDVQITGVINAYNQCSGTTCNATTNFWRSVYNLTLNVNSGATGACYNNGDDWWAVSQAAPMRRVHVNGTINLQDICEGPGYASGGFFADDQFSGGTINNYGNQQWITRQSNIDSWGNGVWNQVFCGDNGAPGQNFGSGGGVYTTLGTCGTTEEEPYLYADSSGNINVFAPSLQNNGTGPTWANANTPGTSLSLNTFYVVNSSSSITTINQALAVGDNLLFTPGVYSYNQTINVTHADTKVIGLGMATLVPSAGNITMSVADVKGVNISGIIFDAGPTNSPALLQVGTAGSGANYSADPVTIDDVFFRIGGATAGSATTAFIDNSNYSIMDDLWSWRADHGAGVGWTSNTAANGLIVNGNNVSTYGLFVEHYQQYEVIWNGQRGKIIFFQNENPYDPPSQAAWEVSPSQLGYPAIYVPNSVASFNGYGLGSYCFFSQGVNIHNSMAFQSPAGNTGVQFHDLTTVFLTGSGGIDSVIDGTGGAVASGTGNKQVVNFS